MASNTGKCVNRSQLNSAAFTAHSTGPADTQRCFAIAAKRISSHHATDLHKPHSTDALCLMHGNNVTLSLLPSLLSPTPTPIKSRKPMFHPENINVKCEINTSLLLTPPLFQQEMERGRDPSRLDARAGCFSPSARISCLHLSKCSQAAAFFFWPSPRARQISCPAQLRS